MTFFIDVNFFEGRILIVHFRMIVDIGMISKHDCIIRIHVFWDQHFRMLCPIWLIMHYIWNHAGVCRTEGPSWENCIHRVGVAYTVNNRKSCWVITILANSYKTRIMFDAGLMDFKIHVIWVYYQMFREMTNFCTWIAVSVGFAQKYSEQILIQHDLDLE